MVSSASKQPEQLEKEPKLQLSQDDLLDLSFDAVLVRDAQDRIEYWNQGAVETYGYTQEEALGRSPHDLLRTEFPIPLEHIRKLLDRHGRWSGEITHTRKDGKKVIVSSRWSLKRDAAGTPVAILESNRDITEHTYAEKALRENEQRLQFHIENTPLAVIEWGPDFRLSRWSAEAERIFGWRADEVLGKRLDEFRWVCEGDLDKVEAVSAGLKHGTRSRSVSRNRNYRKDGSLIHCEWYNSSIVDASGNLVSIFSLVLDVTERKSAEEALRIRESRLRVALAASDTGTFRWNPSRGEFLEFDDNLKALFGRPDQFFRATDDLVRCVHPDDLPELNRRIEASRTGADFDMEYRIVLPDGQIRCLYERGKMEFEDGHPKYLVGACTDITRRKLAENALVRSEKLAAAGRLASTIAHEINNPLEAVTNLLYLISNDSALPSQLREHVLAAEAELDRVSQMAKRTLSFYRAESVPRRYCVAQVVEEVLRLFSPILKNRSVQVRKCLDESSEVVGLSGEIRQVCTNLISNAIDAGTRSLAVRVSRRTYWKDENECAVRITVADRGSGIPPESLKRIFEPFFTTKSQTGTGLGLWVCHEIVRNHGGSIRVRSTPGKGTVFSVYLPAGKSKETNREASVLV
jgi:PAS domain S-box-containing protein